MNNELLKPEEILIKDKKKMIKGTIERAAISFRSKIMEVQTTDDDIYYLIFYKNSLVYGEILEHAEAGSFIDRAFNEGIVFDSPHPIIKVLTPKQSVSIPNKNKLFSHLQANYPLQEIAYIATTLDSFFDKEQLIKIIDKVYYHFRRNGNFSQAFQVIEMLTEFAPSFKSANERKNSPDFFSYHDFYNTSSLPSIQKKDPFYAEVRTFKNRYSPEMRMFLEELLKKENRLEELLLLKLEEAQEFQKAESVKDFTEIALHFVSIEEWIAILGHLDINPFRELPETKTCIEKMLQEGNYETAALLILNFVDDLPDSYGDIIHILCEKLDSSFVAAHLDGFLLMIQQQINEDNQGQMEERIFKLAVMMLEQLELKTVGKTLLPIQKLLPHSSVIGKINKMIQMLEDPDMMMELGQKYAEFKQWDKAIDCFFWEMELQPQDPIPVLRISKMYQQKGMKEEAAIYQKIYSQLKSNQEAG